MNNPWEILKDRITGKAPKGAKRSSGWRKTRKDHLELHPECGVCGRKKNLIAHHLIPFHIAPDLEEEPTNLTTLCERPRVLNCHIIFGHLKNFRRFNPSCELDIMIWHKKLG